MKISIQAIMARSTGEGSFRSEKLALRKMISRGDELFVYLCRTLNAYYSTADPEAPER
jgi:hypothetical protein